MLQATEFAKSTFETIRLKIIKVAAYVKEMKTKIKVEFSAHCPQIKVISRCLALFEVLQT